VSRPATDGALLVVWMKQASYLELGRLKDGLCIEHDGIDP
jgi:hypothetical protein